jgi:hypothetical protein
MEAVTPMEAYVPGSGVVLCARVARPGTLDRTCTVNEAAESANLLFLSNYNRHDRTFGGIYVKLIY